MQTLEFLPCDPAAPLTSSAPPVSIAAVALAALVLLLGACSSDASLRAAPELVDDPVVASTVPLGGPSDGTDNGGGASSPWAGLDPGDMPDTVFAVAWVDLTEGCINCYYAANAPDRYDIVDPLGQVLSSFELPFDWEEESYYPPPLRSLEASGPGRFIVSNLVQSLEETNQVVWEADAYTGEARVLARIYSRRVELPQTGEVLLFADEVWAWDMQVLPDPMRDGALLIVPTSSSPYLPTLLKEIWSVPYDDAAAPVLRWPVEEFAPDLQAEDWSAFEPAGLARLADDGSGRLVVGLQGWVPDDRGQLEHRVELAAFWPESDLEVRIDSIPEELMHPSARVVPGTEDSSVIVLAPSYNCSGPLSWWEDGLTTEIVLPEGDFCPTLGPLLDLPSRTFVYSAWYGDEEYPDAHRIVVHGAGQELWSIERLRRGLSERPFHLLGAIALER